MHTIIIKNILLPINQIKYGKIVVGRIEAFFTFI